VTTRHDADAGEELLTLDSAADYLISAMRANPTVAEKGERQVHRVAEQEAWANAELAKRAGNAEHQTMWAAIAGRIAEKCQALIKESKSTMS
jgi:hypothetical protein